MLFVLQCFFSFLFKVPYHIDEGHPSYLIIAGLVFTPLSEPLIEYVVYLFFIYGRIHGVLVLFYSFFF